MLGVAFILKINSEGLMLGEVTDLEERLSAAVCASPCRMAPQSPGRLPLIWSARITAARGAALCSQMYQPAGLQEEVCRCPRQGVNPPVLQRPRTRREASGLWGCSSLPPRAGPATCERAAGDAAPNPIHRELEEAQRSSEPAQQSPTGSAHHHEVAPSLGL